MMISSDFATEDVRQVMINISKLLEISDTEEELPPRPLTERLPVPSKPPTPKTSRPSTPRPSLEFLAKVRPQTKKISAKKFQEGFVSRMQIFVQRKQEELMKKREKLEEEKKQGKRDKPEINPDSKKLVGNPIPIHDRYPDYIKDKQKRLELLTEKQKTKKDEEFKDCTFKPNTNDQKKRFMNPEQFVESMAEWKVIRDKNTKHLVEKREAEIKSNCTFKPIIGTKSQKIIKRRKSLGRKFMTIVESQEIPIRETDGMEPQQISDQIPDISPEKLSNISPDISPEKLSNISPEKSPDRSRGRSSVRSRNSSRGSSRGKSREESLGKSPGISPEKTSKKSSRRNSLSRYFSSPVYERLHSSKALFSLELYGCSSPGKPPRRSLSRPRRSISSEVGPSPKGRIPSSGSRASLKGSPPKPPSLPKSPSKSAPKKETPEKSSSEAILSDLGLANNMISI
jgi:hypothetical protein